MSLKHNFLVNNPYFYPVGNTPAVCLTQNLPSDCNAKVLLLGCGDIRNILFTAYAGAGIADRDIEYTCCDVEVEILARNIIALTLISDDANAANIRLIWNVYYHVFFDKESHSFLCGHAEKLLRHTQSIEQWNKGPYGRLIRFCDSATLHNVVKLWKLYAINASQDTEYQSLQAKLENEWAKVQRFAKDRGKDSFLNAIRSVAPLIIESPNASKGYESFWKNGHINGNKKLLKKQSIANPMFAHLRPNQILHYCTDPLLGFHLATAFVRLSADSPLSNIQQGSASRTSDIEKVAFQQFSEWCRAFRNTAPRCTIRFVHADALAFCHVLYYHRINGESVSAHWYKHAWDFHRLVLDSPDYCSGSRPPTEFNIIDTSNLMDHLGSLNILAAASPLLVREPYSTLRTELLVPKELTVTDSIKVLLCGDLSTNAILCGLQPVQYWRNSTATWHISEEFFKDTPMFITALSRHIVIWKPTDVGGIEFHANDLAKLVFNMYLKMFQTDGINSSFELLKMPPEVARVKIVSYDIYTRASLAALLYRIKQEEMVPWDHFIKILVDMIFNDDQLMMGPQYHHSMCAHFSALELSQFEDHPAFHSLDLAETDDDPFCIWNNVPLTVYVTLVVPHNLVDKLQDFTEGNYGTPIVHAMLQSPTTFQQSTYPDVQLGFGNIFASGTPFTNDYTISVHKGEIEGPNTRPLIVSFLATTASLFLNGGAKCQVIFGLKSTFGSAHRFTRELGIGLQLYKSTIGSSDVFVTKFRPNLSGSLTLANNQSDTVELEKPVDFSIRPHLDSTTTKITSLQLRCTIKDGTFQALLKDKAHAVTFSMKDPFTIELKFGDVLIHRHKLALPLNYKRGRGKIARKSSWVEYTAPIMETSILDTRSDSIFVASISTRHEIALEHLHYVHPDVLPIIHVGKKNDHAEWVNSTVGTLPQMSSNEYAAYVKYLDNKATNKPGRFGVKESIFNIISHFLGLNSFPQSSRFMLMNASGIVGSIFVHKLRMDVSNQTVFLDAAAVLAHSGIEAEYHKYTDKYSKVDYCVVNIDEDELPFWKYLLPMFAERCRAWKHKTTCEYIRTGNIPLSTDLEERSVCSCGLGIFPIGYLMNEPAFRSIRKHAVRVAIPVVYSSPIGNDHAASPSVTQSQKDKCFRCDASQDKNGEALLRCSGCKVARYCSNACQKAHWREHKQYCSILKETGDSD